jgi:hypothetical protein
MATKLTRLTHKIAIQLHLVAKSCTICSFLPRRPVRKLLYTLSCTIKMDFKEIRCEGVDWMHLAQDRVLVNTVMNLYVPQKTRNFLTIRRPLLHGISSTCC